MPASPLLFRACCGCFTAVFVHFMWRRAMAKQRNRVSTVRLNSLSLSLVLTFAIATLLLQCGDIETNPGPPKQTKAASKSFASPHVSPWLRSNTSVVEENVARPPPEKMNSNTNGSEPTAASKQEPTLTDVISFLKELKSEMNTKIDNMNVNVNSVSAGITSLEDKVKDLVIEIKVLKEENEELRGENMELNRKLEEVEHKVDDLEGRSRRNNIIYGTK